MLAGSGKTRGLAIMNISVVNGAPVYVTINSPAGYSISGSPQTAVVYRALFMRLLYRWILGSTIKNRQRME